MNPDIYNDETLSSLVCFPTAARAVVASADPEGPEWWVQLQQVQQRVHLLEEPTELARLDEQHELMASQLRVRSLLHSRSGPRTPHSVLSTVSQGHPVEEFPTEAVDEQHVQAMVEQVAGSAAAASERVASLEKLLLGPFKQLAAAAAAAAAAPAETPSRREAANQDVADQPQFVEALGKACGRVTSLLAAKEQLLHAQLASERVGAMLRRRESDGLGRCKWPSS